MKHDPRVDAALEQALERDAAARSQYLAALREAEPEIAAELEELLHAHEITGVLDAPPAIAAHPPEPVERRIGPYRVLRELGRGGMGVVYLAERDDGQFRRRVAVKLLRNTPDAEELQQRFIAERQILALLDHPNIAQLIDGGVTDGRLPYLVMEYVEGMPITQYCERHRLTIEERLRVFQGVCAAVHHAHSNLVLHRDLKPGNILVTQTGQVKLLDFGIAKLLNPRMALASAPMTWTVQHVFTPEYASPEQLRGEPISTTSDVYALGVVLYELLTGRRPHQAMNDSQQDLVARICEQDPPRPSQSCTNPSLCREMRGDLDAIALMALRKEPGRRYGSADLLADDINRYLEGLPVLAHRGSRWYYISKFARRHRVSVGAAAVVAASLVGGAAVAIHQSHTAREERDRAQQSLHEAEEVTRFLVAMFQASDPSSPRTNEITARDLLRNGLLRAEELRNQPILQARMLDVIGQLHHSLSDYAQARTLLERALAIREAQYGKQHLEVAQTLSRLAESYRFMSDYAKANQAAQRALDIRIALLGPAHPDVAKSMLQVAVMVVFLADVPRAEKLTRQAAAIREAAFGPNDSTVANALLQLASVLSRRGQFEEAETHARRAIEIQRLAGAEHPQLANAMLGLAYLLERQPRRAREAETLFRQGLEMRRRTLGPNHPLSNYALGDLVWYLRGQRRFAEALPLGREHVRAAERIFGPDNPRTGEILAAYAGVLSESGRPAEAIPVVRKAMDIFVRTVGTESSPYAGALVQMGLVLDQLGKPQEGEPLIREGIRIREKIAPALSGLVALYSTHLADVLLHEGNVSEAERSIDRAVGIYQAAGVRPTHPDYQHTLQTAARVYDALGQRERAEVYRRMMPAN